MTVFQPLIRAATELANRLYRGDFSPSDTPLVVEQSVVLDPAADLAAWLAAQSGEQKLFWRARDGSAELAVLGWESQKAAGGAFTQRDEGGELLRFCCSGFDSGPAQRGCSESLLLLPELALWRDQHGTRLRAQFYPSRAVGLAATLRSWHHRTAAAAVLPTVSRHDLPDFPGWCRGVDAARRAINRGELAKVVLARASRLCADADLPLWTLFQHWRSRAQRCYQLAVQQGDCGFLSFSPERLFLRDQRKLCSEALAGTMWHHEQSPAVGCIDAKLSHEHRLVVDDLKQKLAACCDPLQVDEEVSLYPQANMQHLYCGFSGQLRDGVGDAELIKRLHPTAAVNGLPAAQAREFIRQHEELERGWYAGCFGPLTRERSEIAVGIRSARLEGLRLDLFAGAGIVAGSDPQLEWQELERKISLPLSLFEVVDSDHSQEKYVSLRASES